LNIYLVDIIVKPKLSNLSFQDRRLLNVRFIPMCKSFKWFDSTNDCEL